MSYISASPEFLMMLLKNKKSQNVIRCVNCDVEIKKPHWCKDCYKKWKRGEKVKYSNQNKEETIPDFYLCDN
mgnify:CR=1 FL=1